MYYYYVDFLFHPTLRHLNFGADCPNITVDWADLRFGFVHSTDIIEQNKSVYHNQDTSTHIWWIAESKN